MNVETEEREVTKTKLFVTLNAGTEHEVEVEAPLLLEVLESVMGTDGFMAGVKYPDYREQTILEALEDAEIVGHTHSAGWHETDEDAVDDLWERVAAVYYEEDVESSRVR